MTTPPFPIRSNFKTEADYLETGVYRHLTRLMGTELYRHFKTGDVIPPTEDLVAWLHDQVWDRVRYDVVDYTENAGKSQWTIEYYQRQLERAVGYCLETYDPEAVHAVAVAWAKAQKRGAKFTLAKFRLLDLSLTNVELAKQMGCSPKTIKRRRDELEIYDAVLGGEFDAPVKKRTRSRKPWSA